MSTFQELLEKMGLKGHKENTEALGFSERMKKMFHMKEKFAEIPEKEVLTEILQSDMENIRGTMESLDKDAFSMAAELIQNAKKNLHRRNPKLRAPGRFPGLLPQYVI